jgi:hypothetical protein
VKRGKKKVKSEEIRVKRGEKKVKSEEWKGFVLNFKELL